MAIISLQGALLLFNNKMEVLKCFYDVVVSQQIYKTPYFHLQSHKIPVYPAELNEIPSCKHEVSGAVPAQHDQPALFRPPKSVLQIRSSKILP